jgi:AcrR family transcriptional regulator
MNDEQAVTDQDSAKIDTESPADSKKRLQILDGARKVFLADGFDGASMNEIARVAGVSKGTLYVYFASKEALFEELIWHDRRLQSEHLLALDDDNHDIHDVLFRLATTLLNHLLDPASIALVRTVIAISGKQAQIGRAFYAAGPERGITRLARYLDSQVAAGLLDIPDTRFAAIQFFELCLSGTLKPILFGLEIPAGKQDIARAVTSGIDLFLAGYAPRA